MSVRSELRLLVFEWAQNQCEHPRLAKWSTYTTSEAELRRCDTPAAELAHIWPRGMGHTGYRDTLDNVMAACTLHARSTDDLSSPEWGNVPAPGDRKALAEWVRGQRVAAGWSILEEDPERQSQ